LRERSLARSHSTNGKKPVKAPVGENRLGEANPNSHVEDEETIKTLLPIR